MGKFKVGNEVQIKKNLKYFKFGGYSKRYLGLKGIIKTVKKNSAIIYFAAPEGYSINYEMSNDELINLTKHQQSLYPIY